MFNFLIKIVFKNIIFDREFTLFRSITYYIVNVSVYVYVNIYFSKLLCKLLATININ